MGYFPPVTLHGLVPGYRYPYCTPDPSVPWNPVRPYLSLVRVPPSRKDPSGGHSCIHYFLACPFPCCSLSTERTRWWQSLRYYEPLAGKRGSLSRLFASASPVMLISLASPSSGCSVQIQTSPFPTDTLRQQYPKPPNAWETVTAAGFCARCQVPHQKSGSWRFRCVLGKPQSCRQLL